MFELFTVSFLRASAPYEKGTPVNARKFLRISDYVFEAHRRQTMIICAKIEYEIKSVCS